MIKILVPTYIPSLYERPVKKTAELVKGIDAEVHLLYIFDESMRSSPTILGAIRDRIEGTNLTELNIEGMAERFFSEASETIGRDVSTKMVKGKPSKEILKYATRHKIGIIMMPYDKVSQRVMEEAPKDIAVYQIKGAEVFKEVRVVNREGEKVVRKAEVGILNAQYDVGEEVQFLPMVAAETKEFKAGEVKPLKIHTLEIPPNYYAVQSFYARHGLGHPIAMGGADIKRIENGRTVDYVSFLAVLDGRVEENDLVSAIALFPFKEK
ncbi:MAG: DUF22 domain-containing protein [Halobacteriota archaeon]|nr:DUF22 domain-containing protein [Halobacteriota archaeon]